MPLPPPAATDTPGTPSRESPLPGAYLTLALLLLINLFNYVDRQLLIAVLPKIEESLIESDPTFAADPGPEPGKSTGNSPSNVTAIPGSHLSDADEPQKHKWKLGLLTTAFLVSYLVASPFFGWLAERRSRWLLVGLGVAMWSLASGATGLAEFYLVLLLTRCFAGIGEAAYGPVAPAMLADSFPLHARSKVLGVFYLAIPIGVAAGYVFGGFVADYPGLGWRWAFYFMLPPGIILSLWCLRMREPPRSTLFRVRLRDWLILMRTPSYVLNTFGMTAMMFAAGGIGSWMNYYLYEREKRFEWGPEAIQTLHQEATAIPPAMLVRLHPLAGRSFATRLEFEQRLAEQLNSADFAQYRKKLVAAARHPKLAYINFRCGIMGLTGGMLAILAGSFIADRLRRYFEGAYFLFSGWSMLAGLPSFLMIIITPMPWTWAFIFLTTFCLFLSMGPTSAILANVAHPSMRPAAFALNLFCIHAFGDAISPFVIGAIADSFSLETGFVLVSLILLLGGLLWLWGARFLQRDIELAPTRLDHLKAS